MHHVASKPIPVGIALNHANEGDTVNALTKAVLTDENGDLFYDTLAHFHSIFEIRTHPAQVRHFLAIINQDKSSTVYVNELQMTAEIISKGDIKEGQAVTDKNIAGIKSIDFPELDIPEDSGLVFFIQVGWHRGLYFDLRPVHEADVTNNWITELKQFYEKVLFRKPFAISDSDMKLLRDTGWFPFLSVLDKDDFWGLLGRVRDNFDIVAKEKQLIARFDESELNLILERIHKVKKLEYFIPFIEKGIERYLDGDYISAVSILWLKVEGVLRLNFSTPQNSQPSQRELVQILYNSLISNTGIPGLFLSAPFQAYLLKYYYAKFNVPAGDLNLSRHSAGHGVADARDHDAKRALLSILMIDQLAFYMQQIALAESSE